MKIIETGHCYTARPESWTFYCWNCGCVFKPSENEYCGYGQDIHDKGIPYCKCPKCRTIVRGRFHVNNEERNND